MIFFLVFSTHEEMGGRETRERKDKLCQKSFLKGLGEKEDMVSTVEKSWRGSKSPSPYVGGDCPHE